MRDAVNRLISIGLAVKISHREARVADYMSKEMQEIFRARAALEGIAARSAAMYMTQEEKEALMEIARQFQILLLDKDDEGFMELNRKFHFEIYKSLKVSLIRDMCEQLYVISGRNRMAGYHLEGRSEQVVKEHELLAIAIYNGDGDMAEKIGVDHHSNTIMKLQKRFEQLKTENTHWTQI